ncbi:flagellar protein FlgN [Gracilibacillus sp. YIM 98692]|uniref:flagellar protein FlgN n=1 Tax=Gracilibacillus sp. YIM 98692 TaxID=2663532 RepID=UPI0013D59B51|nr:flagellar protein FlgN [Gracilibacillus sp. YIM 98692]
MSVQKIINHLNKMIELHQSLLRVSEQKTEILKEGKIDALRKLLNTEQKHIQAIDQIEKKRIEAVESWAQGEGLDPASMTVSVMIDNHIEGDEKELLEKVTVQLAELLVELRRQEVLNKQLTEQSMQFVQLSLSMVQPSIKNFNYGKQKNTGPATPKRSVFDSKA